MSPAVFHARQATRRALAHQCRACHRPWALRVIDHPAGKVVVCRFCSTVRGHLPTETQHTSDED